MSGGTAVADRLIDADGHVDEDQFEILARLSAQYRETRETQLKSLRLTSQLGGLFPAIGHLTNIPLRALAVEARDPKEHGEDPESWLYFLNAVGIEKTVLYPTLGLTVSRVTDLSYAVDLCRAYNDWIYDAYIADPSGRFQAAAILPLQVPEAAVTELRRVKEKGFCSVTLPSHGLPMHLGSEMYFPVYKEAQNLDMPLACHGGIHDGFGFDDFNFFAPAHALGHPMSLLVSLGGMMFNRVFEEFPRLRVAYLEGGSAWVLMAAERFSESFKAVRPCDPETTLQLKEGQNVARYMGELMQEGRIVLGCEGGEAFLETAIEFFGCTPFMYSSDFPHEVGVKSCLHELEELNELKIPDDSKRSLRGATASQFYRF